MSVPRLASRSDAEQERRGARTTFEYELKGNGMDSQAGRIECTRLYDVILREIERVFWMNLYNIVAFLFP